jgi:hypothetical protein
MSKYSMHRIDFISVFYFKYRNIGKEAHKAVITKKKGMSELLLLIEDPDLSEVSYNKLKLIIIFPCQANGIDSAPCSV